MNHITKLLSAFGPKSIPDVGRLFGTRPREESAQRRWHADRVGAIVRSKVHQERMLAQRSA